MSKNDSIVAGEKCRTIPAAFDTGVRQPVPITTLNGNFSLFGNAGVHERLLLSLHDGFPDCWKNPPGKTTP